MRILLLVVIFNFTLFAQENQNKSDSLKRYFKYNLVRSNKVDIYLIDSINVYETKKPILGNLYQNPFSPSLEMDLYLPRPDSVKMVLYDYEGNIIDYPINNYFMDGLYRLKPNMYLDKSYNLIFYTRFSDTTIVKGMIILK